jgi:hypothetical protein
MNGGSNKKSELHLTEKMYCGEADFYIGECDTEINKYGYTMSLLTEEWCNIKLSKHPSGDLQYEAFVRIERQNTGEETIFTIVNSTHMHLLWDLGKLTARIATLAEKGYLHQVPLQAFVDMDLINAELPNGFYTQDTSCLVPKL